MRVRVVHLAERAVKKGKRVEQAGWIWTRKSYNPEREGNREEKGKIYSAMKGKGKGKRKKSWRDCIDLPLDIRRKDISEIFAKTPSRKDKERRGNEGLAWNHSQRALMGR